MKNRLDLTQHWGIYNQSTCTAYMPLIFRGIIHFNPRCSHVILEIQHNFYVTVKKKQTHTRNEQNKKQLQTSKTTPGITVRTHWSRMAFIQQTRIPEPFWVPTVQRLASTLCTLAALSRQEVWIRTNFGLWPSPFHLWNEINTHW